jgi:fimbrial isopeptide formation D2 family protein
VTLTLTVHLTSDAVDDDTIENQASVESFEVPTAVVSTPATLVTVNDCELTITKEADNDTVAEGGDMTYTIHAKNTGTQTCEDVVISDEIPTHTDCVSTDVLSDQSDVDIADAVGCDSSDVVTWAVDDMAPNDDAEVQMTVELTSHAKHGDTIDNTACITSSDVNDVPALCDTAEVDVTRAPTATPTATATATPTNTPLPTFTPRPPLPTAQPLPTSAAPVTGTGGNSGGTSWIALGLGLGAMSLMLGFSAMLARKRIRIRR